MNTRLCNCYSAVSFRHRGTIPPRPGFSSFVIKGLKERVKSCSLTNNPIFFFFSHSPVYQHSAIYADDKATLETSRLFEKVVDFSVSTLMFFCLAARNTLSNINRFTENGSQPSARALWNTLAINSSTFVAGTTQSVTLFVLSNSLLDLYKDNE